MHKIIVTSSRPDKEGRSLAAMLNVLFPECEVHVTASGGCNRCGGGARDHNGEIAIIGRRKHHKGAAG